MNYDIKDVKPMNKNTLKAFFTLTAGPMEITNWSYHVKGDKSWVNAPSRKYTDNDGNEKYAPIVKIPDEDRYWNFQKWVCSEIQSILSKDDPNVNESVDELPF